MDFKDTIIVTDLDGTFFGAQRELVPENMKWLEYYKKNGGSFTIATGREQWVLRQADDMLPLVCNIPVIACNGSFIYDFEKDSIVADAVMEYSNINEIMQYIMAAIPGIQWRAFIGRDTYYFGDKYTLRPNHPHTHFYKMPYEELPKNKWYKIAFDGTPEELQRVRTLLEATDMHNFHIILAEKTILEVQPEYGMKGCMLSVLKRLIGKEEATLFAIGDYENDYSMLSMADRCAVPENGLQMLKELPGCIEVCHHTKGAIADLIQRIERL